jgi:hypothetical protein
LKLGITVSVYDLASTVTRVTTIDAMLVSRLAELFGFSDEDIPSIAKHIAFISAEVLKLTRVGLKCVSISLNTDYLYAKKTPAVAAAGVARTSYLSSRKLGQKQSISDRRLEKFNIMTKGTN